ncbi:MAG: hypothetical protein BGO12_16465 [Verrucomicrobia bacterium 61-8]|nr:hypothetical protein [Verrucomicrobiota bacterium]OJV16148.1 MAG: hypothetical protein BGO12_16465 [Verrucomicrobia bacterium 61-8]
MRLKQPIEKSIISRIYGRGKGSVCGSSDFLDLGSRGAVDLSLSRLVKKGILRRLARGVYVYPEKNRLLGELSPRPEEVAKALARRGAQKLLPSGAFAANLLGLTEQVPAKVEYLTDGPSRTAMIRNLPVVLKQSTPARLATAGRVSGTVAQALRFLRKEQVDDSVVARLRERLSEGDKEQLIRDIPLVPAWVGAVFRKVASDL